MTQILHSIFIKDGKIKLVCLLVAVILWGFVKSLKISTIKVSVPLQVGKIPEQMISTSAIPKFATLYLMGEKTNLRFPTSNLKATLKLNSIKTGLNLVTPQFDKGQLPNRVEIESIPDIRLFFEKIIKKELWVKPVLKGKPEQGYQIGQVVATPKRVIVSGPMSQLKNIYQVYTHELSVENLRSDLNKKVSLVPPNRTTSFSNQEKVNISVRIFTQNTKNKKILENVPVRVFDLNPNYNLVLNQKKVSIYLEGNPEILEEVSPEDLAVSINLDNIKFFEVDEQKDQAQTQTQKGEEKNDTSFVVPLSIPVEVSLTRFRNKVSVVKVDPSELQVILSRKKNINPVSSSEE